MSVRPEKETQPLSEKVNTTMNGTQPSNCSSNPTAEKIGQTVAYCLIFLVSLAGNTVIGIIVYKTKTMRKPINFLVLNMAMSDLLFPIFLFPWDIQRLYTHSWLIGGPFGQALCKLVYFLSGVSSAVSIQSLVLIAVDRFGAVVYPLRSPLISSKRCPFFILVTWIVAMAYFSPHLFTFKLEYPRGLTFLPPWNVVFGESSSISNLAYMSLIFLPLVLIAILYIIIYLKLKSHKIPGENSANTVKQHLQRERNVLKLGIAIVLGFAVCSMPYIMLLLLQFFGSFIMSRSCGFHYFSSVAICMVCANCAINPCICFNFSRNFRKEVRTFLKCN